MLDEIKARYQGRIEFFNSHWPVPDLNPEAQQDLDDEAWLIARLEQAKALIEGVEWVEVEFVGNSFPPTCQWCKRTRMYGYESHAPDCKRQAWLEGLDDV